MTALPRLYGWRHQTELGSLVRLITARSGTARRLKHSCFNNVTGLGRPSTGTPDSWQRGDLYADAGTHPVPWDEMFNIGSHAGTPVDGLSGPFTRCSRHPFHTPMGIVCAAHCAHSTRRSKCRICQLLHCNHCRDLSNIARNFWRVRGVFTTGRKECVPCHFVRSP